MWLVASLLGNLGVLAYFKYRFFLAENADLLLGTALLPALKADGRSWVLPVGISFYTFQSMSYCIDCYRGLIRQRPRWSDFMLYVAFFPQLVAGPIVRFGEFYPQLQRPRTPTSDDRAHGLALLTLGLFLKVVLADSLFAPASDALFLSAGPTPGWALAATGTIAFSGQIFCDFAGYSTCAIGCARLLGFHLPENFRAPYAAVGFSDFWRRWHVSLSSWLRDYLYIPLGGNRRGVLRTYVALTLTMLIGGLWHGAAWTFVIWGAIHAGALIVERLAHGALPPLLHSRLWRIAAWLLTLVVVMLAWVFFRAESLQSALQILQGLTRAPLAPLSPDQALVWAAFAGLLACHLLERRTRLSERWTTLPVIWLVPALTLMMAAVWLSPGNARAFIYFQF